MDLDDLLEHGGDFLLKEFLRGELRKEGIDLQNWRRKSAATLSGAVEAIFGG